MRVQAKPAAQIAQVVVSTKIQESVYSLVVQMSLEKGLHSIPKPGQFYMLKAIPSRVLLARPISVYTARIIDAQGQQLCSSINLAAEEYPRQEELSGNEILELNFLILEKGEGTQDLCGLRPASNIEITGPLGNRFFKPHEHLAGAHNSKTATSVAATNPNTAPMRPLAPTVAIVGGGIGVAPVAGFALGLEPSSFDFYASFKTGGYGLEGLKPANLYITTDDGSQGVKGMLPEVLTATTLIKKKYTLVYACGPLPMLAYVQKICLETGVQSWISMEEKMGCGVGACLGCNIETNEGTRRVCKAGPIFSGEKLIFGGAR